MDLIVVKTMLDVQRGIVTRMKEQWADQIGTSSGIDYHFAKLLECFDEQESLLAEGEDMT